VDQFCRDLEGGYPDLHGYCCPGGPTGIQQPVEPVPSGASPAQHLLSALLTNLAEGKTAFFVHVHETHPHGGAQFPFDYRSQVSPSTSAVETRPRRFRDPSAVGAKEVLDFGPALGTVNLRD